jgi:peptidoglycan/LPS O-acetylase OafA/YrhL
VICHYFGDAEHAKLGYWPDHFLSALSVGWSGVDLFFVLSGFLIGGILLDSRDSPRYFRTFYLRRMHRILPIYYFWVSLYAATVTTGLVLAPGKLPVSGRDLEVVPIYLFFVQNIIYSPSPFQWNWLVVTWSLAVEEQFYLFAPPLVRCLSVRRLIWALAAIVCAAPVVRYLAFHWLRGFYYLPQYAMPCRADALALGMLAAVAWRRPDFRGYLQQHPAVLQRSVAYLLILLAVLMWWFTRPPGLVTFTVGYSSLAVFYAALLLLVVSQAQGLVARAMRARWLRYLGGISYCVYLIHMPINQWAHSALLHSPARIYDLKGIGITLLAAVVTQIVAALSLKFIEGPLIRRGHRYVY